MPECKYMIFSRHIALLPLKLFHTHKATFSSSIQRSFTIFKIFAISL